MVSRRKFILTTSAILVTTGCLDGEQPPENNTSNGNGDTPSDNDTDQDNDMEPSPEPEFSLVEFRAPGEVEIDSEFYLTLTVRNSGDASGEFQSGISMGTPGETLVESESISVELEPGQNATIELGPYTVDYLGRRRFRVDEFGDEINVRGTPITRGFMESYTSPEGISINCWDAELTGTYLYRDDTGTQKLFSSERERQFCFVYVRGSNDSDRSRVLPDKAGFRLLGEEREYEPIDPERDVVDRAHSLDEYNGRRVSTGTTVEGWILFNIPAEVRRSNLRLVWSEEYDMGEKEVRWNLTS